MMTSHLTWQVVAWIIKVYFWENESLAPYKTSIIPDNGDNRDIYALFNFTPMFILHRWKF